MVRVITLRRMRLVGYVPCVGELRNTYKVFLGNLKGRDNLEDLVIVRRILLEQFLEEDVNWIHLDS